MVVAPFMIELKAGESRKMSATEDFFLYTHVQRTESTGSIHIRSSDPFDAPKINLRFLATGNDRQAAILAVRRAREIVAASPIAETIETELEPGPLVQSDEDVLDYIRKAGKHHAPHGRNLPHGP